MDEQKMTPAQENAMAVLRLQHDWMQGYFRRQAMRALAPRPQAVPKRTGLTLVGH